MYDPVNDLLDYILEVRMSAIMLTAPTHTDETNEVHRCSSSHRVQRRLCPLLTGRQEYLIYPVHQPSVADLEAARRCSQISKRSETTNRGRQAWRCVCCHSVTRSNVMIHHSGDHCVESTKQRLGECNSACPQATRHRGFSVQISRPPSTSSCSRGRDYQPARSDRYLSRAAAPCARP